MERITRVQTLPNYRLEIEFDDGVHGVVDIADRLFGPVFEPLRDPLVFAQAFIDDFGALCWPNGADLAPDALYLRLATPVKS